MYYAIPTRAELHPLLSRYYACFMTVTTWRT